jgi:hypothetical protein
MHVHACILLTAAAFRGTQNLHIRNKVTAVDDMTIDVECVWAKSFMLSASSCAIFDTDACMYVCVYVCVCVNMMFVCVYVCRYLCMFEYFVIHHVCMYACICMNREGQTLKITRTYKAHR